LLQSADFAVHLFTSATALIESKSLPQIDCLISDIDMPGMDGFQLLRFVRVIRPGLPIILITGYRDRVERLPTPDGTYLRCFIKPFHGAELLAAVDDALGRSRD
jgi:FixJ family two-component response regulator